MIKCDLCGSEHKELPECTICGKRVCDREECSEFFDMTSDTICRECLNKQQKCDCSKCRYQETDKCPMEGYSYVYDCPEYNDEPIIGYETMSGFHELGFDDETCWWPDCHHTFEAGDNVDVEMENGNEGIYCEHHHYNTPFSESVQIESKTRQELNGSDE